MSTHFVVQLYFKPELVLKVGPILIFVKLIEIVHQNFIKKSLSQILMSKDKNVLTQFRNYKHKSFILIFVCSAMAGRDGVIVHQPEHLQQPLTATISHQNCKKLFVQRDYSEGNNVKFLPRFPAELEGRIEKDQFDFTVKMMNNMYAEAGKANFSTFCEGSMACLVRRRHIKGFIMRASVTQ